MLQQLNSAFAVITPMIYWVIVGLWLAILLVFALKLYRSKTQSSTLTVLVIILSIDAFRTLVENVYFGVYFNAAYGLFPQQLNAFLGQPIFLAIPKLINVGAAIIVLLILLRRWFPRADAEHLVRAAELRDSQKRVAAAATEARANQARLTDAIESLNDGFVMFDSALKLIKTNQAIRHFHPESSRIAVPGTPIEALVDSAIANGEYELDQPPARFREDYLRRVASCEPFQVRLQGNRWALIRFRRTSDDGYVGIWTDITQLTQKEQQAQNAVLLAERANAAKSQFLANMSHELRTPLNAIIGFTEIMRRELFGSIGNQAYREYVGDIWTSAKHLLSVIGNILDMSKIETGNLDFSPELVSSSRISKECLGLLMPMAADRGSSIKVKGTEQCPEVWADPNALRKILINLIHNAVKFSPAGKIVELVFERDRTLVRILVRDNGPGMTPHEIERVLAPFGVSSEAHLARSSSGAGLGLSIVSQLVALHDGRFRLEGKQGCGTTAIVELPATHAANA